MPQQHGGEVGPEEVAGHVEEERGRAVGGDPGDLAENDGEDNGGEQRCDEVPGRAKDGLLVLGDEIAAHKQDDEVAVAPEFPEPKVEEAAVGLDDERPGFRFWGGVGGA